MRSNRPPKLPANAPLEILTERQRQVLELREHYSAEQVAAVLGLHRASVFRIQQTALAVLRAGPANERQPSWLSAAAGLEQLSERQRQVLRLRGGGATSEAIARALNCSLGTVRSIEQAAYRRLRLAAIQARLVTFERGTADEAEG